MPRELEIEQAVLGCMLKDASHIDAMAAELESRHFSESLHQRIFDVILLVAAEGDASPLTVHSLMKHDAGLLEVGGMQYLVNLIMAAPSLLPGRSDPELKGLARILRESASRRALQDIGTQLFNEAGESTEPAQAIADRAAEALLLQSEDRQETHETPVQVAFRRADEIAAIRAGKHSPLIATGIPPLDDEIGGFGAGELIVVMGKPGMGKSATMGTIGKNMAARGVPTIIFSFDMKRGAWIDRTVCDIDFDRKGFTERPLWYSKFRKGRVSDEEISRYIQAARDMEGWPFHICDVPSLTMAQITARARAFAAKHGKDADGKRRIGCAMIDYAQRVEAADARVNREQQVAAIARGAKQLAGILDWPVVIGSQMNESDSTRTKEERRPQASDVRESKVIEQEADVVLAPWREAVGIWKRKPMGASMGDPELAAWQADLDAAQHQFDMLGLKNRNGSPFDLHLWAEIGASAIRGWDPAGSAERQSQADMLEAL